MHTATAPKSFVRLVFIRLAPRLITIQYEISGLKILQEIENRKTNIVIFVEFF
jgi:hypothetical protein